MTKYFRWRYFIKPPLQTRFMLFVFAAMVGVVLFVAWNIYFTLGKEIFGEISNPAALDLFGKLNVLLLKRLAIYIVLLVAAAIFLSHKIAGPIYRFEQSADEIAQGRLRHRVQIREGDEMRELQDKLNAMVESLQKMVAEDRARRDEVLKTLQTLIGDPAVPKEKLRQAEKVVAQMTERFEI
jgi:methyl-accepting chemotaxis protein